jgi:cytoskeletal protein RodZ
LVMAATIGEQLRLAREGRGIPLREISDQTRISMHYLEAIETNDYKRLPGGIFNRSFVKAYARYVGYDEKEAVEGYTRYMRELGDTGDEVASTPFHSKVYTDAPATRSPILTVVLAIVILGILTAIALGVLRWVQHRSAVSFSERSFAMMRSDNRRRMIRANDAGNIPLTLGASWEIRKADYEEFLQ